MNGTTLPGRSEQSSGVDLRERNMKSPFVSLVAGYADPDPFKYRYKREAAIGIGQKSITYVDPYIFPSTTSATSFYNRRMNFIIPKGGYLQQILLECVLTATGDNSATLPRLATRLFKQIELCTVNNNRQVAVVDPNYLNARLDQIPTTNTQIESSTNPAIIWNNNTVTVYVPLFMSIFEDRSLFLNTGHMEALQLNVLTAINKAAVGIASDVTDFAIRAMCFYIDVEGPERVLTAPQQVLMATDVYSEPAVALASGVTSVEVPLTVKYPCCNVIVTIQNASLNVTPKLISLRAAGQHVIDLNRRANYSLIGPTWTENNTAGAMTYWFSLDQTRTTQQLTVNMKDLYNKSLYVEFDKTPDATYSIYVQFEYFVQLVIEPSGTVYRQLLY